MTFIDKYINKDTKKKKKNVCIVCHVCNDNNNGYNNGAVDVVELRFII